MHFGAFAATSTTFEGLDGTGTGLNVPSEATQRPGLREGASGSLRVCLGGGAIHRRRLLAGSAQSISGGGRSGGGFR